MCSVTLERMMGGRKIILFGSYIAIPAFSDHIFFVLQLQSASKLVLSNGNSHHSLSNTMIVSSSEIFISDGPGQPSGGSIFKRIGLFFQPGPLLLYFGEPFLPCQSQS
jgi:hypothetical protein